MSERNEEKEKNFEIARATGLQGFSARQEFEFSPPRSGSSWSEGGSFQGYLSQPSRRIHSIIAMNLETVEDVDGVIQYCEMIKAQITKNGGVK